MTRPSRILFAALIVLLPYAMPVSAQDGSAGDAAEADAPSASSIATSQAAGGGGDVVLDRIVAVVNDGVVLASDLQRELAFVRNQARSNRQSLPGEERLRERVLERLIDQEVRRQQAARLGIAVDASSVNRAVEQIARGNNMDALTFRETLLAQGFDYNQFRQNVEQELLLQRLVQREVEARIRVSGQEIDDFLDGARNDEARSNRYRLRHILIAIPPSASSEVRAEARARAAAVVARLRQGADFATVAADVSDGARALEGGDLGWRALEEIPAFLATTVKSLSVGDVSEPVRSPNGLHVVKLEDLQSGTGVTQSETLARHIFIAGDDPAVEQRLRDVARRIRGGESFASIAESISEDPNSAPEGGELPWFRAGELPAGMETVASQLPIGQLSEPFRTQFGWHIMEVLERRDRDLDDQTQRRRAEAAIAERKIEQETERWIRQLRDESFIDIRT